MKKWRDIGYDIECFLNFFSVVFTDILTGNKYKYEISQWVNQLTELKMFLYNVQTNGGIRFVGFNNIAYDYVLLHDIMCSQYITYTDLYLKSQMVISDRTGYKYTCWPNERLIPQLDLYKIHHFDNKAKRTSLKMIEFCMRSRLIQELPFDPTKPLTYEQSRILFKYNEHDVDETISFYHLSKELIDFRDELSAKHGKDFTNHNDTKIGSDYFIMELAKHGIKASKYNQTHRPEIRLNDIILPTVQFERPEFNAILDHFKRSVIKPDSKGEYSTFKGFFKGLSAVVDGFSFDFGAGGIHGSVKCQVVESSTTHDLIDVDVKSYYPNLAIANGFYPQHLGSFFCDIYLAMYQQRSQYDKNDPINGMLKLALNGVYGKSNDKHSAFYDPQYTMSITINGQLLLCMLAEQLMKIPNLKMVQINTDGLTFLCPKEYREHSIKLGEWWMQKTGLELESVDYTKMAIRDVNSYLAVTKAKDNKPSYVKRIGAYAYVRAEEDHSTRELPWHKNHGGIVIAKAAEAALVRGENIGDFIRNHAKVDIYDFFMRTKVPRSSYLELRSQKYVAGVAILGKQNVERVQNISRYIHTKTGGQLVKVMPPTEAMRKAFYEGVHIEHKNTGEQRCIKQGGKLPSGMWFVRNVSEEYRISGIKDREIKIGSGRKVTVANDIVEGMVFDIDYDFYIEETRKLVDKMLISELTDEERGVA